LPQLSLGIRRIAAKPASAVDASVDASVDKS
jgi:hypothetical protein